MLPYGVLAVMGIRMGGDSVTADAAGGGSGSVFTVLLEGGDGLHAVNSPISINPIVVRSF